MSDRAVPSSVFVGAAVAALSVLTTAGARGGEVGAAEGVRLVPIAVGTAKNTVNVVVFRKHSLFSHGKTQVASFYDGDGRVILAKRTLPDGTWETKTTDLKGSTRDAHNAINIGIDGDGYLHLAWDHHGNPLRYRRSREPLSLDLVEAPMTGQNERSVTYPEFHRRADGSLLFLYRDGASGRGNLVLNRYDPKTRAWTQVSPKLIDGEGERNAYWQACTDAAGTFHLSWVWRETGDVATNHDLCYARSTDGGATWTNSRGEPYTLPITMATAEVAVPVPQKHELINQTSMAADAEGRPYIATYWRPEGADVPQYFVVHNDGKGWNVSQASELKTPFRLGGGGTKRIPISRPQILARQEDGKLVAHLIYRTEEGGGRAILATCNDLVAGKWSHRALTTTSLGQWEPTYDPMVWETEHKLHLLVQHAEQVDGEGVGAMPPQMVYVAEVSP